VVCASNAMGMEQVERNSLDNPSKEDDGSSSSPADSGLVLSNEVQMSRVQEEGVASEDGGVGSTDSSERSVGGDAVVDMEGRKREGGKVEVSEDTWQ